MAEHVVIYWAGGLAGATAAHLLYPTLRTIVYPGIGMERNAGKKQV